jgi:hypothetical protein
MIRGRVVARPPGAGALSGDHGNFGDLNGTIGLNERAIVLATNEITTRRPKHRHWL